MGDGFFDRNLKRLLRTAARPAEASREFRDSLHERLQAEAALLRGDDRERATAATVVRGSLRRSPWAVAAAAMTVVFVGGLGVDALLNRQRPLPEVGPESPAPGPAARQASLRVPADRAVVMEVPRGAQGALDLVRNDVGFARLDLTDGAEVELKPGLVPVLALHGGLLRVEALHELSVSVAQVEIAVARGALVEIAFINRGDRSMIKSWLVPGGVGAVAGAAGAALVAILVHRGEVEVKTPESRPAPVAVEKPLIVAVPATRPVADDDRGRKLAQAEQKIAELEKKLVAAKKEGDKLASDLVKKKGVTIDSITARLADLRKGGMNVLLGNAELIADIKGLGEAGVNALLELLKSTDANDRFIAAKLLEDLKDPATIPALREVALNDADGTAANMAVHALALMGDPRAVETLREVAARKRSDAEVINSLWGLVNLGDQRGMEDALAYVNDQKVGAQARAMLAANVAALMMDRPDVMPFVDAMVRDFGEDKDVAGIAIQYYRKINSGLARERLQAIADRTSLPQAIRDQATQALQQ